MRFWFCVCNMRATWGADRKPTTKAHKRILRVLLHPIVPWKPPPLPHNHCCPIAGTNFRFMSLFRWPQGIILLHRHHHHLLLVIWLLLTFLWQCYYVYVCVCMCINSYMLCMSMVTFYRAQGDRVRTYHWMGCATYCFACWSTIASR